MPESHAAERVLARLELFGMRLGLEPTRRLLSELGEPQNRYSSVLVGGTNGKGSVAAMLAAICSEAGYRTALFTSPHLESVTERLRVNGRPIEMERLGSLLEEVVAKSEQESGASATYFESLFVSACRWFAEEECDIAIFEVGLGGRLDATNVCHPIVSVITEIALEHQRQLGNTIQSIAREKAGIMRRERPVVVGARDRVAIETLEAEAKRANAGWHWAPDTVGIRERRDDRGWTRRLTLDAPLGALTVTFGLPGGHQEKNLVTAIAAANVLSRQGWPGIDRRAVEAGVEKCRWPGRLEPVALPDEKGFVVLDAAHNPSAARAVASFSRRWLPDHVLLFGALDDKDVAGMLTSLAAGASGVLLTRPPSARGRAPKDLANLVPSGRAVVEEDPEEALMLALAQRKPVLVCGSIFLVGEIRRLLRERFGVPLDA